MASAPPLKDRNRRIALYALLGALFMLGLGYASVPLYRLFCQVTGFGGTAQRTSEVEAAGVQVSPVTISVRFDGNIDRDLPWAFRPEQVTQTVRLGARSLATFRARNLSDQPITGRASFNVTPDEAGKYFNKIQCFCFTEQTLQPGEEVRMPVTYYVDPAILQDEEARAIKQITLSYTFHEDKEATAALVAKRHAKPLDHPANAR
ncbi:cytochrome c oxidase assembly protein [Novosphingobium piscinae]|uniref:Cytochrome c oxidase assembly protein CtaG n=1 Tax=Novosphingobium piscinae TaxID=1507448 RepID=A0A7X1FWU4_9SPHN|nr:cytochrome c oxidase assembly protein [Novosphingobium piscinae]MBC2668451.1 cytochrome c oxidase assembly protein [Novosphingobium piscinae]